jgi:hypothetical protein
MERPASPSIQNERLYPRAKPVANATKSSQTVRLATFNRRILEAPVQPFSACWKHRAVVASIVADCYDVIERLAGELLA